MVLRTFKILIALSLYSALPACLVTDVDPCEPGDPFCNPTATAFLLNAGASDDPRMRYLILDDASNDFLYVYEFKDNAPRLLSSIALGGAPNRLALHPNNIFLYSADSTRTDAFELDNDSGTLTQIDSQSGGGHGNQAAVHPSGLYAYSGDFAGVVNFYSIDSGALSQVGSAAPGNALSSFSFTPDGGVFIATQAGGPDDVAPGAVDLATGLVNSGTNFSMTGGDAPVIALPAPNGTHVFVLGGAASSRVEALRLQSGPAFSSVDQTTGSGIYTGGDITVAGEYVFGGTQGGAIDRYAVDSTTGSITALGTFATGASVVTGVKADPTGEYLFVTTSSPFQLLQYSIESDGTLFIQNTLSTGFLSSIPAIVAY